MNNDQYPESVVNLAAERYRRKHNHRDARDNVVWAHVSTPPASGITPSRFAEAHRLADELEAYPPMSPAAADFIRRALDTAYDAGGKIQVELLAMSDREIEVLSEATLAVDGSRAGCSTEDEFVAGLVDDEMSRRQLLPSDDIPA